MEFKPEFTTHFSMGHEENCHAGVVSQILAACEKRLWGEIRAGGR